VIQRVEREEHSSDGEDDEEPDTQQNAEKEKQAVSDADVLVQTRCIPVKSGEEDVTLLSCESCGILFGDDHTRGEWWRCYSCGKVLCEACSDAFLNDKTGKCDECLDPELQLIDNSSKRRKK
jgi:hypothetical protein